MDVSTVNATPESAPLLRRLAAVVYDAIAVTAVSYFAAFVPVLAAGGKAIEPGNPLFLIYVLGTVYAYFAVCWARGRTLGMQAWKLAIVTDTGRRGISWRAALTRFSVAFLSAGLLGLGYANAVFDREGRTWHDRLSRSRIVRYADR